MADCLSGYIGKQLASTTDNSCDHRAIDHLPPDAIIDINLHSKNHSFTLIFAKGVICFFIKMHINYGSKK